LIYFKSTLNIRYIYMTGQITFKAEPLGTQDFTTQLEAQAKAAVDKDRRIAQMYPIQLTNWGIDNAEGVKIVAVSRRPGTHEEEEDLIENLRATGCSWNWGEFTVVLSGAGILKMDTYTSNYSAEG